MSVKCLAWQAEIVFLLLWRAALSVSLIRLSMPCRCSREKWQTKRSELFSHLKRIINKKIPPVRLHISSAQVVWRCPSPSRHKAFLKVLVIVCGKIRTKNFFDLVVFHFNNSICIFTDFFIMSYHNNCFFQLYFYLE